MPDYGDIMARRALRTIDRKLTSTYARAEQELTEKLQDFTKKHKEKNKEMLQDLADGLITKEEYQNWLDMQIFRKQIWQDKIKQAQDILLQHQEYALSIIRDGQLRVFAENYDYFARMAQRVTGMSFSLTDPSTVARLIKTNPKLLPKWKIDKPKEYKWSYKKAKSAVKQGIIQGESIDKIAKRLAENLSSHSMRRMELFARTAVTGAESAGRIEMLRQAKKKGIRVRKKWLATKDSRTRDTHAEINGEEREVEDMFSNGLLYPGDPDGSPAEVYNCRCRMTYVYPDFM